MDLTKVVQESEFSWRIPVSGKMRVPGILYGNRRLIEQMDEKVYEQLSHVAALPGVERAAYAMPDAHWGYGFPIGGVAAVDPQQGGVISAGGVGFDISCGVRTLTTRLTTSDIEPVQSRLADILGARIPAGVGRWGEVHLKRPELDAMLCGGAKWAVDLGYGNVCDLERIEEQGCMKGAEPDVVSDNAKDRQKNEMGTLGSGNHYLEIQQVTNVYDAGTAAAFSLREGGIVVSIHCGSRGLGHQIGTEFLKEMLLAAKSAGIDLPDRELACAPIESELGRRYLGAMRAGINCAFANRQIITHLVREAFRVIFPGEELPLLYDVSHNTCKAEEHQINSRRGLLFVHRKGATKALGPNHPDLPVVYRQTGQPVLIGGTMGTASYILVGTKESESLSFSSSCHGAGRQMSRHQASRTWQGRQLIDELEGKGILIRSASYRGVAEEAPGAYKDVVQVVDAAEAVGLSRKVARLEPLICVKG